MSRFGFTVVKTLITAIDPSPQVKNAMDSINAAQREKEATRQRAEAQRIQIETQAAAEAEKTRLQGEGQANYRREMPMYRRPDQESAGSRHERERREQCGVVQPVSRHHA